MIYTALPERICKLIRAASDRLATVEIDDANNCLRIDGQMVERSAAIDYFETWRKSGLWALRGTDG